MMSSFRFMMLLALFIPGAFSLGADLFQAAKWKSVAFDPPASKLAVTGADVKGTTVAIVTDTSTMSAARQGYFRDGARFKNADPSFSGSNGKLRRFDGASERWIKSLFDKVVATAKTTVKHGQAGVVDDPKIDLCQTFHMHVLKHETTHEIIYVIHNREYCKAGVDYQTCKTKLSAAAAAKKDGCDVFKEDTERMSANKKCSCEGGFGKHLFVYSPLDKKLYYWDKFEDLIDAAILVPSLDKNGYGRLYAGGWYSEVSTSGKYKVYDGADINIVPENSNAYLCVGTNASHDEVIGLFTAAQFLFRSRRTDVNSNSNAMNPSAQP